jgi:predicted DsbA family dithiol-disulfide isomerase
LRHLSLVELRYYTDPLCPWSWALEPALRKLLHEFGDSLRLTYVLGGMMRAPSDPSTHIRAALDAGARSGMPVDPRLWFEGPPSSSHPACIAVKAAAEQGDPGPYLRRLREGFMCHRRKLDAGQALTEEARATPGVDADRFRIDLASHGTLETFAADLERSAGVRLPALEFDDEARFEGYDACSAALAGRSGAAEQPSIEDALRRFGSMATAEVAAVCDLPGPRAPAELWRLASEWRIKPERVLGGELWTLA